MDFMKYWKHQAPRANIYVYDNYTLGSRTDYIMYICATSFLHEILTHAPTWIRASGERCITPHLHHLLITLHKLNVRPQCP